MSAEIATAFSRKYAAGIELTAQQLKSVLEGTIDIEPNPEGEMIFRDQVGVVRMQPKVGRATDIPIVDTPHRRRALTPQDFEMRDFADSFDRLKVLNDPVNSYTMAGVSAGQRKKDKIIIDALLGTAYTGKAGTTPVTLPSAMQIASASTGFTFAKLQEAIRLLRRRNAIMQGEAVTVVYTSYQEKQFMNVSEVKSVDYNTQKVLVEGEVGTFYTCHFKRVEDEYDDDGTAVRMLPLTTVTRTCLVYPKSAGLLAKWKDVYGRVEWNVDRGCPQITTGMSVGCTRMQETKVVRMDVIEN